MEMIEMARKIEFISAMVLVCFLLSILGCDKKAATASNFEDGLNQYFQGNPECISTGWNNVNNGGFPLMEDDSISQSLQPLVEFGALSKTHVKGSQSRYELTPAGRTFTSPKNPSRLCYGVRKIVKILNFTEPDGTSIGGSKMSTVSYTWKLANVPAWAQSLAASGEASGYMYADFDDEMKKDALSGERKGEAQLVLTHLGWQVDFIDGHMVSNDQ
jgi:hypothetical protein